MRIADRIDHGHLQGHTERAHLAHRVHDGVELNETRPEFDAAWQDRLANRRAGGRAIAKQLAEWGELSEEWTVTTAGDWVTSMASVEWWAELVIDLGWSSQRFTAVTARVLKSALLTPRG